MFLKKIFRKSMFCVVSIVLFLGNIPNSIAGDCVALRDGQRINVSGTLKRYPPGNDYYDEWELVLEKPICSPIDKGFKYHKLVFGRRVDDNRHIIRPEDYIGKEMTGMRVTVAGTFDCSGGGGCLISFPFKIRKK